MVDFPALMVDFPALMVGFPALMVGFQFFFHNNTLFQSFPNKLWSKQPLSHSTPDGFK